MSTETGEPPLGPAGPDGSPQPATSSLLVPHTHDACVSEASGPSSSHVTQEDHCEPIKSQPQSEKGQNGVGLTVPGAPGDLDAVHPGVRTTCKCSRANAAGSSAAGGQTCPTRVAAAQPEPSTPVSQTMERKLRSSLSVNSDGSRHSKGSSTESPRPPLPEDCCVHCILACLFCEFLTLCNLVVAPAWCGPCASESCCCCCCCCAEDMGDDCNCPCDMDCGIMDACCESSDCLEICMECCGICFPS
ncbi:myoD family inhibitor domain-containing protein [Syngnathoides biaculeatus]|uniref:myoD family inhibitor domain-containing protein n=1 Tax=Syngnathoides biaculeatus TaxID=300417 RepID=UPI002ADDB512|nr:myoD family inhibitor domain-containing protein [Syngnathoides biaculeatus]